MTDAIRATVWQATWLPFGAPQAITGTATLDARFPGQWFQLESGLHQNWWRHYDPTTGRYTQPDPLGFVDGPSVYGYASLSPMEMVDPSGLRPLARPNPTWSPPGPFDVLIPGTPTQQQWTRMCVRAWNDFISWLKPPTDDAERCRIAERKCRDQCIEYAMGPDVTPGIGGSDRPGHFRRCMRECMANEGCPWQ